MKTIEEVLQEKGEFVSAPLGVSMLPLIRPQCDVVLLSRDTSQIGKYDVVLYKRKNGKYILHRILGQNEKGYILCGDNQYIKEYGIQKEQILAVMKGFYRGENRYIDIQLRGYRIYSKFWCYSLTLRRIFLFGMRVIGKIKRCVKRGK